MIFWLEHDGEDVTNRLSRRDGMLDVLYRRGTTLARHLQ